MSAEERFWRKVVKHHACWLWTGTKTPSGYGSFSVDTTKRSPAHRFSYEVLVSPIPKGKEIDHLCRNRSCVNPEHMEVVDHAENMRRSAPALKAACVHGHALEGENLYRSPKTGRRQCKTCRREAFSRYLARRNAILQSVSSRIVESGRDSEL